MSEILYRYLLPIAHAIPTGGQQPNSIDLKSLNPLGATNLLDLLKTILTGAATIAIPIVGLMIIYGAFKIITGGANPNNVKEGRQIITWAIVGYIIILIAGGVTSIVTDFLNGGKGGLNPNSSSAPCDENHQNGTCPSGQSCQYNLNTGGYSCQSL